MDIPERNRLTFTAHLRTHKSSPSALPTSTLPFDSPKKRSGRTGEGIGILLFAIWQLHQLLPASCLVYAGHNSVHRMRQRQWIELAAERKRSKLFGHLQRQRPNLHRPASHLKEWSLHQCGCLGLWYNMLCGKWSRQLGWKPICPSAWKYMLLLAVRE